MSYPKIYPLFFIMVCDPYAYMRSYHSSYNAISMTISFGHGFTSIVTLEVELGIRVLLAYLPKVSSRLSLACSCYLLVLYLCAIICRLGFTYSSSITFNPYASKTQVYYILSLFLFLCVHVGIQR